MPPDDLTGHEPTASHARAEWEADARRRLDAELAKLPPVGSPLLPLRLRQQDGNARVSLGTVVALLRGAVAARDLPLVEELFVLLLLRVEGPNSRWAARVVANTPAARPMRESVREDLKQELTLYLWQRIATEGDPAWELYFERALAFAQRHIAMSSMRRHGYWAVSTAPERLPPLLFSRLAAYSPDGQTPAEELLPAHDDRK